MAGFPTGVVNMGGMLCLPIGEGSLQNLMGGLKMLSKNTCEGVHLLVKLKATSLQVCKFTKNELLHPPLWQTPGGDMINAVWRKTLQQKEVVKKLSHVVKNLCLAL